MLESKEISNPKELEFTIFCIESVAERLNVSGADVYKAFTKDINLIDEYIVPAYDVLHTQGKEYIIDDILECLESRGISI